MPTWVAIATVSYTHLDVYKRQGEDKDPKKLYFSVYLWIQNLLNTKNIISVYRYTGNANDDGYLDAPNKQIDINSKYNAESYRDLYLSLIHI